MRILVIEDEPRILAFLARGLRGPRRDAHARPCTAAGAARQRRGRAVGPRVSPPPPPRLPPGRGRQPGAPALRRLGLPLRPALERGRRLRPAAPAEARHRRSHRDGATWRLSARGFWVGRGSGFVTQTGGWTATQG